MILQDEEQRIFLVISQTGTILSRILKFITGAEYNHVSIGLSEDLKKMYSFGRLHPYNPILGGFVIESPDSGTFKRFKNTKVVVLSLEVGAEKHDKMLQFIEEMISERKKYHYNYLGVVLASVHLVIKMDNRYYCSEFVREFLRKFDIEGSHEMEEIVQPIHFFDIPFTDVIYKGKLQDYSLENNNVLID